MINRIKTQIKINKARKESKKLDKEIVKQNVEIEDLLKRINQQEKLMKKTKSWYFRNNKYFKFNNNRNNK